MSLYPEESPLRHAWFQLCREKILPQIEGVPEPFRLEQYEYPQQLQRLRIPFSALFAEQMDSYRPVYLQEGLQHAGQHARVSDLSRFMEAAVGPSWLELLNALRLHRITSSGVSVGDFLA